MNRILSLISLVLLSGNSIAQTSVETDLSFNTADTIPYGTGASGGVSDAVVQSDGKIIIVGPISLYNGQPANGIVRLNPDGTKDNTFSAWYNLNEYTKSICIQPDGKILIGGAFTSFNGTPCNKIVRLNSDGSVDSNFDSGTGVFGPNGNLNSVTEIVVDGNGKIILGGWFSSYDGNPRNCIVRLNNDGTVDNTFNVGLGFSGPLNEPAIYSIQIQNDGKLLIGGRINGYDGFPVNNIVRLNIDGSIDNTFTIGSGFNAPVFSINVLTTGEIIAAGDFSNYNGNFSGRIAKLLPDGTFDSLFNTLDSYTTGANQQINKTVVQSDGKIIVVGNFNEYNEVMSPGIIKLKSDGSRDTVIFYSLSISIAGAIVLNNNDIIVWGSLTRGIGKYNSDGTFDYSFLDGTGANAVVTNLTKQPDGKIIACGGFRAYNGEERFNLVRLNTDGTRDTTFNFSMFSGSIGSALVQPDGKILISGNIYVYSGIFRLNSDGTMDPTFNMDPAYGYVSAMALQTDGKIVAGTYFTSSGIDRIVRFNPDGTLDNSFEAPNVDGQFFDLTIQPNGQILVGGAFDVYDANYSTVIAKSIIRLNTDGSMDNSFGVILNIVGGVGNWIESIAIQPDQKILIAGNFIKVNGVFHYRIARINPNGSLDSTFVAIGANSVVKSVALSSDGKIVMGGFFTSVNGTPRHFITRLNPNGTLDPSFTLEADTTVYSVLIQDDGNIVLGGMFTMIDNMLRNHIGRITGGCSFVTTTENITQICNYVWPVNGQTYTSSGQYIDTIPNAAGCDSIITLNLTINNPTAGTETQTACDSFIWPINGQYYISSGQYIDSIPNAAGCDSIITLDLTIIPSLPLTIENSFSMPSDANSCTGEVAVMVSGNPDFELDFDNGSQVITSNGYSLVTTLCPGMHDLQVTDNCGDTLSTSVVIPIDSNYVFNNPFIDSLAIDSLGVTMTNCDIYYNSIDTAYIDSIWANGNTVNVIWNIIDSNGSNFDTTSYVLNNGNGVYWLQLSIFCPFKSTGEYFTVTEAIYFNNGNISTAGLPDYTADLFEIYPNPTNDQVHISFSGSDAELTVYDLQGKVVLKDRIQNHGIVSLENFERGVYLFDFKNSQGHSVQRVVKQ